MVGAKALEWYIKNCARGGTTWANKICTPVRRWDMTLWPTSAPVKWTSSHTWWVVCAGTSNWRITWTSEVLADKLLVLHLFLYPFVHRCNSYSSKAQIRPIALTPILHACVLLSVPVIIRCPFYCVPEHGSFITQKACIRRGISWQQQYMRKSASVSPCISIRPSLPAKVVEENATYTACSSLASTWVCKKIRQKLRYVHIP